MFGKVYVKVSQNNYSNQSVNLKRTHTLLFHSLVTGLTPHIFTFIQAVAENDRF